MDSAPEKENRHCTRGRPCIIVELEGPQYPSTRITTDGEVVHGCGWGLAWVRCMGSPLHAPLHRINLWFAQCKGLNWKVGGELYISPEKRYTHYRSMGELVFMERK